mmetsp:Transcript_36983/g.61701  ORF Transcript_36983/g.61701 Transcript_36983/m.61701 type:complete len:134 (-) Transcript_36983:95-496(-)
MGCGGTKAAGVLDQDARDQPISTHQPASNAAAPEASANADAPAAAAAPTEKHNLRILLSLLQEDPRKPSCKGVQMLLEMLQPPPSPTAAYLAPGAEPEIASISLLHELAQENQQKKWDGIELLHQLQAERRTA